MISYEIVSKRTVESCLSIDVRQWVRVGALKSGQPFYLKELMPDGEYRVLMTITPEANKVYIDHDMEGESVRRTILLDHTACNLGGNRAWLKCPECNSRVAKLFLVHDKLLCRACGRLGYRSQVESTRQRNNRQATTLRSRLGPILGKPLGMRLRTYGKTLKALAEAINK